MSGEVSSTLLVVVGGWTGGHGWQLDDNAVMPETVAELGPFGTLVDGLRVTRRLPEDKPWPCQPEFATATFAIVVEDVADIPAVTLGASVIVRFFTPRGSILRAPLERFDGYVTDVTVDAHPFGVIVTVTAVEWGSLLSETVIGNGSWPYDECTQRINRVIGRAASVTPDLPAAAGYAPGPHDPAEVLPPDGQYIVLNERPKGRNRQPALKLLLEVLDAWTVRYPAGATYPGQLVRYTFTTGGDLDPDTLRPLSWAFVPRMAATTSLPPGRFAATSYGWGVSITPETAPAGSALVPAGEVALDARWSQRKDATNNSVTLTITQTLPGADPEVTDYGPITLRPPWLEAGAPFPVVSYNLETQLDLYFGLTIPKEWWQKDGTEAVADLAAVLLPGDWDNVASGWSVDTFTWHLPADRPGAYLPKLGEVVTVAPIPAHLNPNGNEWTTGVLDRYTLIVERARPRLEFGLRPQVRDSVAAGVFKFSDLPAGVTIGQLSTRDRIRDLRLLASPTAP